jgi:predicted Fe-S protein YdhL (DUF1289 family)
VIADAITNMSTAAAPSVHERAIKVLTENYSGCLSDMDMVSAYTLMTDKSKAAVFVALPANHCRKLWLLKQIGANISDS